MSLVLVAAISVLLLVVAGAGLVLFSGSTARRVQQALPPLGRFVDVPGARLHVWEQGEGPPLLLIHGLGAQLQNYTYGVVERLADRYRVVAVDRPGSGYSTSDAATAADISTQAAALAALIDRLQLGRPLVVGHSLGGAIALTLALEHPDRVAGLALVAPVTHAPDDVPAAFKALTIASPAARKLVAWTLAVPGSIAQRDKILGQVFGPEPVPIDYPTRGGGLLGLRPSQFLAASADLQALPDKLATLSARYSELRLPVAVLYGRSDRILDWKVNGRALVDKLPGATLQLVDGGHMLPVTQPALTADFIASVAQRVWNPEVSEVPQAPEASEATRGDAGRVR